MPLPFPGDDAMKRGLLFLALCAGLLLAMPSARAADKDAVNRAIDRGVKQLKSMQAEDGSWPHDQKVGATALAALTLLECGVPIDDPAITKAARVIRDAAPTITYTYAMALSVLFLDRLGEAVDQSMIESLTARLLAGQNLNGGWGYDCPGSLGEESRRLTTLLKDRNDLIAAGKTPSKADAGRHDYRDLPKDVQEMLLQYGKVRTKRNAEPGASSVMGDNSNTQFVILALFAARKHGLPVDAALGEAEERFRRSQVGGGAWSYVPMLQVMADCYATPSMTCAGLLALGYAYAAGNESALRTDLKGNDQSKPGTGKPALRDPEKDPAIKGALALLGKMLARPLTPMAACEPLTPLPERIRPLPPTLKDIGAGRSYYFLWSLERVCVAYDLDTLGDKDWFDWGAEFILKNQGADGGWHSGEFDKGGCDTCFALLFLRRANLSPDVTRALKGRVKDPGLKGELRATIPSDKIRNTEPADKPDEAAALAAKLGGDLLGSDARRQDAAIEQLRDAKGAAFTDTLAAAIPKLDGGAKKKAREALAERLSRMTSATLGDKLRDDNLEVRRAAALACAMKEDKAHCQRLIELLDDAEVPVQRAAYAALKSLSGEDHGPSADATRAEKVKATAAWKAWWEKNKK
jgi:hypothetical protein